ncbi:protein ECERIFERUM 16 [Euphorbia lathyris]|uniref:protein ECERIFERUM 16 n=1 Tax=Euphorbia lathyris TaxID=212925 RepID=UPI003314381F
MDAKSLAKSKRAHSLHHSKKPHAIQKAKALSGGTSGNVGSANKAIGKQAKEKAQLSALPSNWDRYEDEFEGSEGPSGDSMNKATDSSFPKSKGADYRHLIAEAQSQHQSNSGLDSFLSLDDIFPGDFNIGVGPILSVRGEGILSWIGDDNFVVEDETTGNPEAQFVSLNLNALAEQLEKVTLSQRLFIEADLLPPELTEDRRSTIDRPDLDQMHTGATDSEEPTLKDLSGDNKVANQNTETTSSWSSVNVQKNSNSFIQGSNLLNQTTHDLNSKPDSKSHPTRAVETPSELNSSSVAGQSKKLSVIEATAAEAELDMLLDTFNETKLLDPPGTSQKEALTAPPQFTGTAPSSSRTINFATELDDLLEEASNSSDPRNLGKATATSNEIKSTSSQSVSKSKVLDDFDSWLDTI